MMKAPIADFVRRYAEENKLRLHMPGHKGEGGIGAEKWDITEIPGADSLYAPDGIISQSEDNAASLFGSFRTYYSAEGSSLSIRAMVRLAMLAAAEKGIPCKILAGRNAHSSFVSAAALLDADVEWLWGDSYLSCLPDAESLEKRFSEGDLPTALYITSPDYLGNVADIAALADVCHRHGVLLLVDNAHGAYLKFLPESCHPIDLGADAVADSAHKTLPVLTGGGYLHIGKTAPAVFAEEGKRAMALFGSTSPSYLILTSLDLCNLRLAGIFGEELASLLPEIDAAKKRLRREGWDIVGNEPLKITLRPKSRGYLGKDLAERLAQKGIVAEFSDRDFVVLMLPVKDGKSALVRLEDALKGLPAKAPIIELPPVIPRGERRLSLREAMLSPKETVPVEKACGRVLASAGVLCPPAVPIVQMGEKIGEEAVKAFLYYGISHCTVIR